MSFVSFESCNQECRINPRVRHDCDKNSGVCNKSERHANLSVVRENSNTRIKYTRIKEDKTITIIIMT
jgi:hypothetical protein